MRYLFAWLFALTVAACTSPAIEAEARAPAAIDVEQPFNNFITRKGARLYDGEEEFRFLSVNIPTLWFIEDDWAFERSNPYRLPTEFEIRDVLGAARQMGGNVVRAYTIPVRNSDYPEGAVTFVEAPGRFNETAFRTMDLAIAIAAENGIRLVIPLVNNWPWHGGRPNYAAFRGLDNNAFCTDPQLRADFKKTIEFVTTRVNTVTGIPYNQDPTIMAWETGNEMTCPAEWGIDVARTIKSFAPHQLVVDGRHSVHMIYEGEIIRDFPLQYSVDEPAIDLISTHHYEEDPAAMMRNLRDTVKLIDGKKPIFLGEFSFMSPPAMEQIYNYVISEPDIPGGMIWSLRRHHQDGGWLHHSEPLGAGLYRAYHWPGFDDGEPFGEREFLRILREKAYEIRGLAVPELPAPPAPVLLPIKIPGAITWQGALGASSYDIERAHSADGPWKTIAHAIDDIGTPGFPLFSDTGASLVKPNFYRVIARNISGLSKPSNVIGPVDADYLTLVDKAESYGVAGRWKGISVERSDFANYKEAYSRLTGTSRSELLYVAAGPIREVRVYAYEPGKVPALSLSLGGIEEKWQASEPSVTSFPNHRGLTPRLYRMQANTSENHIYAKIDFGADASIVRVEIDYETP